MKFDTLNDLAFELGYAIEAAAKAAGWHVIDTGKSAQSCSTYITLYREDEAAEAAQTIAIRISDHTARSCISPVDYYIALGGGDWTADVALHIEETFSRYDDDEGGAVDCDEDDDDAEHTGYSANETEFDQVVAAALAAAEATESEEI